MDSGEIWRQRLTNGKKTSSINKKCGTNNNDQFESEKIVNVDMRKIK